MAVGVLIPNGKILSLKLNLNSCDGKTIIEHVFNELKFDQQACNYFGLQYVDKEDGCLNWLFPDDKYKSFAHLTGLKNFQLSVKVFPKSPDLVFASAEVRRIYRQHLKTMLLNNKLGCATKVHAFLDALIVQAEAGDFQEEDSKYLKRFSKFEVLTPTSLTAGTPITEAEYMKLVKTNHRKLAGLRSAQADVMFLNEIQNIPYYGYVKYNVKDKNNGLYFIAFSEKGIHFIYEEELDNCSEPKRHETLKWNEIVFFQIDKSKAKLGIMKDGLEFEERSFKVCSTVSKKSAHRMKVDFENHKATFLNIIDGHSVFDTRKEAQQCYTNRIPRKQSTWNVRMKTMRSTLRLKSTNN